MYCFLMQILFVIVNAYLIFLFCFFNPVSSNVHEFFYKYDLFILLT